MSSTFKPLSTPSGQGVPPQQSKPMHPQTGPGPYSQQMPQNLVNMNPNQAHNLSHNANAHQNHYSLNIPNSYQPPQATSHPVANQSHIATVSYSSPKNQVYNQSYQMPHTTNIPATQSLPATQPQEAEKPQSNGTTDFKPKSEPSYVLTTKKDIADKVKMSPEKATEAKVDAIKPLTIEPAEVPQNVSATATQSSPPCAPTSTTLNDSNIAQTAAAISTNVVPTPSPTIVPPVSSVTLTKSDPPSVVGTKTESSSNSPTSSGSNTPPPSKVSGTSTPVSTAKSEDSSPPPAAVAAEPQVRSVSPAEKPSEPQEAQSTTVDISETSSTAVPPPKPKSESTPCTSPSTKVTSPMKLATTPRTPARKSKTLRQEESPKSSKSGEPKAITSSKSPSSSKAKRIRTRTQPYQSPIPELEIISKMTHNTTPRSKNSDEKLIIFYKYEFLAVRNQEGSFYICQAVQNVYKSSPKIRIRWLSQEKGEKSGEIYTPDFYDTTDFDCILTNLNLERVDKSKFRLPPKEKDRTDNILKRAIAVEKGEATSLDDSLTEDNPDGLDVSLYKDEEQLKKRRGTKRKSTSKLASTPTRSSSKASPDSNKLRRVAASKALKSRTPRRTPMKREIEKKVTTTPSSAGRAERAKRRSGQDSTKSSPVVDQKKAKVLAKVAKRTVVPSPKPTTTPKTVAPKSTTKQQPVASTSKAKPTAKLVTPPTRRTKRTRK